jgi:NADH dehydrogenase (ubiquinone) Fe-S protein 2
MSFATRLWARKFANAAPSAARASFLRPTALRNYKPLRTMATATTHFTQEDTHDDYARTTITEDKSFGGKFLSDFSSFLLYTAVQDSRFA